MPRGPETTVGFSQEVIGDLGKNGFLELDWNQFEEAVTMSMGNPFVEVREE